MMRTIVLLKGFIFIYVSRRDAAQNESGGVQYDNNAHTSTEQTMPYTTPLPLSSTVGQKECQINKDGYLIAKTMENTDFPVPYVEFDDDIYLKSIRKLNDSTCAREGNVEVKMQMNPSYFGTNIPDNNSTEA